VRSAVRALSAVGPLIVGVLADAVGLRWALVALTPVYAVGGVIMLGAARHYPADVAFVVAESRRVRAGQTEALVEP
jgi:MFS family permease